MAAQISEGTREYLAEVLGDDADLLKQAWHLRINQQVPEAMRILARVQIERGWEQLSIDKIKSASSLGAQRGEQESLLSALLLKASIFRATGQEHLSSTLLRRVYDFQRQEKEISNFRLLFELGLDAWSREEFTSALDWFLMAEACAIGLFDQTIAAANLLWCLEALDLPRLTQEEQLADKLKLLSNKFAPNYLAHLAEQWLAYQIRKSFYEDLVVLKSPALSGQPEYLTFYFSSLPYAKNGSVKLPEKWNSAGLWQGSYRMRTIYGLWSPLDKKNVRVGDAIDRLYLWVWRWMHDQSISLEKIYWTLDSILERIDLSEQSKENLLLFRNACSWLNVFNPKEPRLRTILPKLQSISSHRYQVLQSELCLILSLSEESDSKEVSSMLGFDIFRKIYKESVESNNQKMCVLPELVRHLNDCRSFKNEQAEIKIDLALSKITSQGSIKPVCSPRMCEILQQLETNLSVQFEDLSFSSDEKRSIYNTLARLRKLLGPEVIKVRGGEITRGSSWPRIQILYSQHVSDKKDPARASALALGSTSLSKPHLQIKAAQALLKTPFERRDIQKIFRISKASACRILKDWTDSGQLTKSGKTKQSKYMWANKGNRKK